MPKSLCDTCAHDCRQPIGSVVFCDGVVIVSMDESREVNISVVSCPKYEQKPKPPPPAR